jgi:hypothetical protein
MLKDTSQGGSDAWRQRNRRLIGCVPTAGEGEANPRALTASLDKEGLYVRFTKTWWPADKAHCEKWHKEAFDDYEFAAGRQWTDADKKSLEDKQRLPLTFDRTGIIIDSVTGSEVANRQEVRYIPRTTGDADETEVLTEGARWFRDQCDAEHEESHAFRDTVVCGMGWTETRLDYEDNPDGEPKIERIDPLCMYWDHSARKPNLTDARRIWRIYRDMPIEEARDRFPDVPDEHLDAAWARGQDRSDDPYDATRPRYRYPKEMGEEGLDDAEVVTLVEVQWVEREPYYRGMVTKPGPDMPITDPTTGQPAMDQMTGMPMMQPGEPVTEQIELSAEEHEAMTMRAPEMGWEYRGIKQVRKVHWRAFVGSEVLEFGKLFTPPGQTDYEQKGHCKDFGYNAITGKLDRNKGLFYGLMRVMRDPQRFANKYMSLIHDIIAKSAKGGIMAERTAFDDPLQAEESWASHADITWVKPGALNPGAPKIQPKPMVGFPPQLMQMVELAFSSVRDSTGVNAEILGSRSADQAASLEYQRRQAATTILATLFDSLKLYRLKQGRVLLYLINNFLNDGRLIRITGEDDQTQYKPFMLPPGVETYDVIVDDSPTSPNQKEQTWAVLTQLFPYLKGLPIPPTVYLKFLEQSPLPASAVAEIKGEIEKAQQQAAQNPPPDPLAIKQKEKEIEVAAKQQERAVEFGFKTKEMEAEFAHKERERQADMMHKAREHMLTTAQRPVTIDDMGNPIEQVDPVPALLQETQGVFGQIAQQLMAGMQHLSDQNNMTLSALQELSAWVQAPTEVVRDPSTNLVQGAVKRPPTKTIN